MAIDFGVTNVTTRAAGGMLGGWASLLFAFTYLTAFVSFTKSKVREIRRRKPYWYMAILCLVVAGIFTVIGLGLGPDSDIYRVFFNAVMANGGSAAYAMVGFMFFSIAFRALRLTSVDSAVFFLCWIFYMIFAMPMGQAILPQFFPIGNWVQNVVNVAGARAATIAAASGMLFIAIRSMLGLERGAQTGGEKE